MTGILCVACTHTETNEIEASYPYNYPQIFQNVTLLIICSFSFTFCTSFVVPYIYIFITYHCRLNKKYFDVLCLSLDLICDSLPCKLLMQSWNVRFFIYSFFFIQRRANKHTLVFTLCLCHVLIGDIPNGLIMCLFHVQSNVYKSAFFLPLHTSWNEIRYIETRNIISTFQIWVVML